MPRMIDQIRTSSLSANLVQAAARGALVLPPEEIIEILVYLANHNKVFGQQARMTLAGWDEKSSRAVAADPKTPVEVLQYLASPDNLRPPLLCALLDNPSLPESALLALAHGGSREVLDKMAESPRVRDSARLRSALQASPRLSSTAASALAAHRPQPPAPVPALSEEAVTTMSENPALEAAENPEVHQVTTPTSTEMAEPSDGDDVLDSEITAFMTEHADEIAAEAGKAFQPIGGMLDELEAIETPALRVDSAPTNSGVASVAAAAGKAPAANPAKPAEEHRRGSTLQKISRLDVKGRIQLAMKGNKEERSILVRDGTKIVALAVLDSPKITDSEVEGFANQKNVLEAVLRAIPMKRRFAKNYAIVRNIVFNPRSPIDVSLPLMKHILVGDLKNLSGNKQISETVRKMALKMFKQKTEASSKK
jgi:hypothetical protein